MTANELLYFFSVACVFPFIFYFFVKFSKELNIISFMFSFLMSMAWPITMIVIIMVVITFSDFTIKKEDKTCHKSFKRKIQRFFWGVK